MVLGMHVCIKGRFLFNAIYLEWQGLPAKTRRCIGSLDSVYMIYIAASRMKHLYLYTRHFQEKHYHTWFLPKISMSYVFFGSVNFCLIQGVQAGFSGIILTPDFMGQPFEHQIVYAAWQLEVGGGRSTVSVLRYNYILSMQKDVLVFIGYLSFFFSLSLSFF